MIDWRTRPGHWQASELANLRKPEMEIVYLLVPLSVGLALIILGIFAWATRSGQFDDLEREGLRILEDELVASAAASDLGVPKRLDPYQPSISSVQRKSTP